MKTENLTNGDRIRIWLEDSQEPEGGIWVYGNAREVIIRRLIFVEDGRPEDIDNEINSFINYKIEKL
jgi:hypothetical protein